MEEIKDEEIVVLEEVPAVPALDLTAKCDDCGFLISGCHKEHTLVELHQLVILNGKKFPPGVHLLPTEAKGLWSLASKEKE